MQQSEIAFQLIDIKSELELYKISKDETVLQNAIDKINLLGDQLDFSSFLNAIKRGVFAKMKESASQTEQQRYYNQYQLLKNATTFDEVTKIIK